MIPYTMTWCKPSELITAIEFDFKWVPYTYESLQAREIDYGQ